MKHHEIMDPMGKLGVQSCVRILPHALGQQIPLIFFFLLLELTGSQTQFLGVFLLVLVCIRSRLLFIFSLIMATHSLGRIGTAGHMGVKTTNNLTEQLLLGCTIKVQ